MFKRTLIALTIATPLMAEPEITILTPGDFVWETSPEGVAFAPLQGARFEGSHMTMVELPSGITSPPHTKSAAMFGVMIQGDMKHYATDANAAAAPIVSTGGFYVIPADMPHISACVSNTPCVTYLYQDGAFDFVPVTP